MSGVSSPTNAEIMRTFHLFSDRWPMLCTEHGVFSVRRVDMATQKCPVCLKGLVLFPEGTIPVWDEKEVR